MNSKSKKSHSKKDWTKNILIELGYAAKVASIIFSRQSLYQKLNALEYVDKNKIGQAVRNLHRNKYIRVKNTDGPDSVIQITPLGLKKLVKYKFDDLKLQPSKKWDGMWRIVIFDIPEKKKIIRQSINLKLKELGFEALQKSTFIYPYDCRKEIEFIKSYFYLKNEINFIVADEIDNEEPYLRLFNL